MSLEAITLSLLLSLPCSREEPVEQCHAWRSEVAPVIAGAAEQSTAAREWPGEPVELVALLVTVGYHESTLVQRIQRGECRSGRKRLPSGELRAWHECDAKVQNGRVVAYLARSMWQIHDTPLLARGEWFAMLGAGSEPLALSARVAARLLSRGRRGCGTIAGALAQYGGAAGCGWPGVRGRQRTYAKLLALAAR